jgi:glutamyl-tRNA reductase
MARTFVRLSRVQSHVTLTQPSLNKKRGDGPSVSCQLQDKPLQEIVVLSATHSSARSMRTISDLTVPREGRALILGELKKIVEARELYYLATCNRVVFATVADVSPREMLERLQGALVDCGYLERPIDASEWITLNGRDAIEHLVRVSCALESMVLGERQIFGQVKQAYRDASDWGLIGSQLHYLLEQIFKTSKHVYDKTGIARGRLSMVHLILDELKAHAGGRDESVVALVGAGETTRKTAALLAQRPGTRLIFVNRTLEKAEGLANEFGGRAVSLDAFRADPPRLDVLVSATAAPEALFGPGFLGACRSPGEHLLAIDLAVPPDIAPVCSSLAGVRLVHMDLLRERTEENRRSRRESLEAAEALVKAGVDKIVDGLRVRAVNPLIGELVETCRRESLAALDEALADGLAHLSDHEKQVLRKWVARTAERWAVMQVSGLRETARRCCPEAVGAYLEGLTRNE